MEDSTSEAPGQNGSQSGEGTGFPFPKCGRREAVLSSQLDAGAVSVEATVDDFPLVRTQSGERSLDTGLLLSYDQKLQRIRKRLSRRGVRASGGSWPPRRFSAPVSLLSQLTSSGSLEHLPLPLFMVGSIRDDVPRNPHGISS